LLRRGPNVMAENVQHLNKHDICFKNIGCCCTVVL